MGNEIYYADVPKIRILVLLVNINIKIVCIAVFAQTMMTTVFIRQPAIKEPVTSQPVYQFTQRIALH